MSTPHDNSDGSDIFWPGYVDAVTNLVLNLLFLLTIMTVAVFMFALELGRATRFEADQPQVAATQKNAPAGAKVKTDPEKENLVLKQEIERLKLELAHRAEAKMPAGGLVETVEVATAVPKPLNGLDKALATEMEVIVRFKEEAVAFTQAEHDQLRQSLQPIVARGKTSIRVEVPPGFSEAKRMGYYRAMSVRNLLIEMNLPKESIDVSVLEGKNNANAALVKVRALE